MIFYVDNNNNNNNCLKSNIQCIEIRVQWTVHLDAMVAVTVMRVLLFVLHVCMLRECGNAAVGDG